MTNDDNYRTTALIQASLRKRYARERRFRLYGMLAVFAGFVFLFLLLADIVIKGSPAFTQYYIKVTVDFNQDSLDLPQDYTSKDLARADFGAVVKGSLREMFPGVSSRAEKRRLYRLISVGADYSLRDMVIADPALVGKKQDIWLLAHSEASSYLKGQVTAATDEAERKVKDVQMTWLNTLREEGRTELRFNTTFFLAGDSREPELAGIKAALVGSFYTLLVTFCLAFPIGVMAAIYLEEFAPRNRLTDLIEININNLAAVPSIVFGLLGLAVFINWMSLPRSAPLVGGLVLTLLTLPVIIIASRAAIKAVPPSIREAALGVGASQMQVVFHHVLPLAMPGMLTGAIIGMSRALGESAPLLMIGMIAFVVGVPGGVPGPATALPVQIYLWADSPERAFAERTSAAIIVLLVFLLLMNLAAVLIRRRMERKW